MACFFISAAASRAFFSCRTLASSIASFRAAFSPSLFSYSSSPPGNAWSPPPCMTITSVATPLRNSSSCETTTTMPPPPPPASSASSHSTPWRSKWLVGSSRKRTSGLDMRADAIVTRILHPPLRAGGGMAAILAALKPNPSNIFSAACRAAPSVSDSRCVSMSPSLSERTAAEGSSAGRRSRALSSSSCSPSSLSRVEALVEETSHPKMLSFCGISLLSSCATTATLRWGGKPGSIPEAARCRRVDLPAPFLPRSAYLRPWTRRRVALDSSSLPAYARERVSTRTSLHATLMH
mmetsp:Transcript_40211/g.94130  ORF Transcript_40211/g.94130 Transcript_40211/m.94130 type:complete len:294 (-) Transcript_40211:233-1114(-)